MAALRIRNFAEMLLMTLDLGKAGFLDRFPEHLELESFFNYMRPLYRLYEEKQVEEPRFMGVGLQQWPLDPWLYQEVLFKSRPRTVVEIGSGCGKTTEFWNQMLFVAYGHDGHDTKVISVDVSDHYGPRPYVPGITWLLGNSLDQSTYDRVAALCQPPVLVTLDSEHSRDQVYHELRLWGPLASPGQYCIVQDTWLGVWQAQWEQFALGGVRDFMAENHDFVIDLWPQRWMFTQSPFGWLRKK